MSSHITIRMAWHDSGWNGRICKDPSGNVYCVGNHSLLSARIARNRDEELEKKYAGSSVDEVPNGYVPPCFYSLNAYSNTSMKVRHAHPFKNAKADPIEDALNEHSVFTWPFRLAYNHSSKKKKMEGTYPPDLEDRITRFRKKLKPGDSLAFLYLNYDNPITGDDDGLRGQYVIAGCAPIKEVFEPKKFDPDKEWITDLKTRNPVGNKNFPIVNWAFQITADTLGSGVKLPYHEYLEYLKEHPEEQEKLERIKVAVNESPLIPHFKYVASDMGSDSAIYLLYKIRKALLFAVEDHIVDTTLELEKLEVLISKAWRFRGLYPSLAKVIYVISGADENEDDIYDYIELVDSLKSALPEDDDLLNLIFGESDSYLEQYLREDQIDLLSEFSGYLGNLTQDGVELAKKISLFELTPRQIRKILFQREKAFKRSVTAREILDNPYLLCEEYQEDDSFDEEELSDQEEASDGEIGIFSIDIGLNPDRKYFPNKSTLQKPKPSSPERMRALIIEYLSLRAANGDSFVALDDLYEYVTEYPLFYKSTVNLTKDRIRSKEGKFWEHLSERIDMIDNGKIGSPFYYLREVEYSEKLIKETIDMLLEGNDLDFSPIEIEDYNRKEAEEIAEGFSSFNKDLFIDERNKLLKSVFGKRLYVISGKPGSGKTKVLDKVISELSEKAKESLIVVAPTGKAAIRLRKEVNIKKTSPQTIDRFIYGTDFREILESFQNILKHKNRNRPVIENLIIDESSMVDLQRFAVLMEMLWTSDKHERLNVKRLILVGDENQLPPVGIGRPFYDIIQYLCLNENYKRSNFIRLKSNCRSKSDQEIMKNAELFENKNRYYVEKLEKIVAGGKISEKFDVEIWKNNDDLQKSISKRIDNLIVQNDSDSTLSAKAKQQGLYRLLGLNEQGLVNFNGKEWEYDLENFQVLTPYRTSTYGTIGLNKLIKTEYNSDSKNSWRESQLANGDKIIRLYNWYGRKKTGESELKLSNGSIGVVGIRSYKGNSQFKGKCYYFPEAQYPLKGIDNDENFDHAYAITVHKAQGSEFEKVFLVIPMKRGLLTKELVYTALTRAKDSVTMFLQSGQETNPLTVAIQNSAILSRNSSLFEPAEDMKNKYWPSRTVGVRSKIEYIIFQHLAEAEEKGLLSFKYEEELKVSGGDFTIHPDFTIKIGSETYYWEHLGLLDMEQYYNDWQTRLNLYRKLGLYERLITTDDLDGLGRDFIETVIKHVESGNLQGENNKFSKHHYKLY